MVLKRMVLELKLILLYAVIYLFLENRIRFQEKYYVVFNNNIDNI